MRFMDKVCLTDAINLRIYEDAGKLDGKVENVTEEQLIAPVQRP